jgi:hypothetical protein
MVGKDRKSKKMTAPKEQPLERGSAIEPIVRRTILHNMFIFIKCDKIC